MNSFTLPAFAKINWLLRIIGKRDDGFHDLFTVFQTVSLHDDLTFSENTTLELTCSDSNIPTDSQNLIIKAAESLKQQFEITKGAKIHLEKRIPSPGGLGGGSSDCATALIGLAELWEIDTNLEQLAEIGGKLGSDVPFFFYGGTAVGIGRGTEILPITEVDEKYLIIVTPNEDVSTAQAFKQVDALRLTKRVSNRILELCREEAKKIADNQFVLYNDFEKTVFEQYSLIKSAKDTLVSVGAIRVLLSGSGSSVFGVFDNLQLRQNAVELLEKEFGSRVFAIETISREKFTESFEKSSGLLL
jgi:4-diphosphocytidyl-2-C-methyl-D-erythritol kinase